MRFILSGSQQSDFIQALPLLHQRKAQAVLADKGYDADSIVEAIISMGAQAVIPPKSNRKSLRPYDRYLYKQRNLIERLFNKMKHFRGVATRYNKTAIAFLGMIHLAAVVIWLK